MATKKRMLPIFAKAIAIAKKEKKKQMLKKLHISHIMHENVRDLSIVR